MNHTYFNKTMGLFLKAKDTLSNIIGLEKQDIKLFLTSSLIYYLGSMPFQNAFSNFVKEDLRIKDYNFESTSIMLFKEIIQITGLEGKDDGKMDKEYFTKEEVDLIEKIIKGEESTKNYLSTLLNTKEFFFDIRKLNDIERDSKYSGIMDNYDSQVPLSDVKVIEEKLAYNEKVGYLRF